ncbi:MAG: peptidase M3, partial [Bacteroidales bacterium]|nr:peptidase M3 [Bacteroidales bacterium]
MKRFLNYLIGIVMVTTALTSCSVNDKDSGNPFFSEYNTPYNVPPFDKIKPEHFIPAFEKGMEEGRKELQAIINNPDEPTFENTIVPLDKMGALLDKVGSAFSEYAGSNTNDEIQSIEMEISPKLSSYSDEISLNPELFKRIKSVYENMSSFNLTEEEQYILKEMYMGFVRNGANLSAADQDKLKEINQRLSVLCVQFDQNVLNETNDFIMFVDEKDLVGLPESVIATAAETAKEAGQEGKWAFTTQRPSMYPFLTYS